MEEHPFKPFLPEHAKLLMLGTFPPAKKRWCMEFYYPNFTNDMWRIFGICYFNDKMHFIQEDKKCYDLDKIKSFLIERNIAMYDTAVKINRTKNTASDKDLEVIEETDLHSMLKELTECKAIVTAGQLATSIFCKKFDIKEPKVGEFAELQYDNRKFRLYRMPSSSRAYPMKVEQKAEYYKVVFDYISK